MDIVWDERFKDEEQKKKAEYVIRNASEVYHLSQDSYQTGGEKTNTYFVIGAEKEPQKYMSVSYKVEDKKIKPLTVGETNERHLEILRERREYIRDNPYRETKQNRKDLPDRKSCDKSSHNQEDELKRQYERIKKRRDERREKDHDRDMDR